MSKVLSVSENNYRVKVQSGGTITLDTGVYVGEVRITGNLIVDGDYTTINVSDMVVEDNIIVLNNGEAGAGITEGTSGLTIDRGSLTNAEFLFDESVDHYDPYSSNDISGTFVLQTDNGNRSGLQLSTIVMDGLHNLYFDIQNNINVLELINIDPDTYASQVFGSDPYPVDPSIIPFTNEDNYLLNKRYLQLYIQSGVVTPGMADVDKIYKADPPGSTTLKSRVQATTSSIQFFINENLRSTITASGLTVDKINVFDNTITNLGGGVNNLILTASNNQIEVNGVINLDDQVGEPAFQALTTRIYSLSQNTALNLTPGRTGIFFKNTITQDELVAKNRALLFSMLF